MFLDDIYTYEINPSSLIYEFESSGPKGIVRKVAKFYELKSFAGNYNFAFGDINTRTGKINDKIVSDNKDSDKILRTLASIIHHFIMNHPHAGIFIQGSTISRTRFYKMAVNRHLVEIQKIFELHGQTTDGWERYKKGINYLAPFGKKI